MKALKGEVEWDINDIRAELDAFKEYIKDIYGVFDLHNML